MNNFTKRTSLLILATFFFLPGCALTIKEAGPAPPPGAALYRPAIDIAEGELLQRHAPHFEVEDYSYDYNRIGAATARPATAVDGYEVYIDTSRPTLYTLAQKFTTGKGAYTNLIYRLHFPKVPWPHLTWGDNGGLLVYVTLNARDEPIMITTLQTCGCYLAMIPTSKLPRESWPTGWLADDQKIYGELLPGCLELSEEEPYGQLVITIRGSTHRVTKVEFREETKKVELPASPIALEPMAALDFLPLGDRQVSFFEQNGRRRGYVKDSSKPLELLLMSWWALDLNIGKDKALGPPAETGVSMYTSLKFWNRESSNIWFFPEFLSHWGWDF